MMRRSDPVRNGPKVVHLSREEKSPQIKRLPRQSDEPVEHFHRNGTQPATAGAFAANAGTHIENGTVGSADQAFTAHQKLARRIVEPATRMRADVVIGERAVALAQDDEVRDFAVQVAIDRNRPAIADHVKPA